MIYSLGDVLGDAAQWLYGDSSEKSAFFPFDSSEVVTKPIQAQK